MQQSTFRKTPLATAIALALGASAVTPAVAQETVLEEVVITGIRASLNRSMDIKREATGVVDAGIVLYGSIPWRTGKPWGTVQCQVRICKWVCHCRRLNVPLSGQAC